jgi:hypothetical protein
MRRILVWPFAALMLLLGGCALNKPAAPIEAEAAVTPPPPAPPLVSAPEPQTLLLYYAWVLDMAPAARTAERQRLESNVDGEDEFVRALHLGLLLLAEGSTNAQRENAVFTTLEAAPLQAQAPENRALAALLSTHLRLRQQLRAAANRPPDTAADELQALREENSRLRQQIDELTSIERQLIERELQDAQNNTQP